MIIARSSFAPRRDKNREAGIPNWGWHHDFWFVRKIGLWFYGDKGTYHFYWSPPKDRDWKAQGYQVFYGGK